MRKINIMEASEEDDFDILEKTVLEVTGCSLLQLDILTGGYLVLLREKSDEYSR